MAANRDAARLTERHRLAQTRLGAVTVRRMLGVWDLLDPYDLDSTAERWLRSAVPIVADARSTSTRLAAAYVRGFRSLELGAPADAFVPVLAAPAPVEQVVASLTSTGPVAVKRHMRGLRPAAGELDVVTGRAMAIGREMAAGAAMRLALTGGRSTIVDSVAADEVALGWARATSGKACAFCAMLASRGPVYRSEGSGEFRAHDHCSCTAEPVYRDDAPWPDGAQDLRVLWDEVTDGLSGADARNAFRAAIERSR